MQLLITLCVEQGELVSPLFKKAKAVSLAIELEDKRVQDVRDSSNACGLCYPLALWLDAIHLVDSFVEPEDFDGLMREFSMSIVDGNTRGFIWDRGRECIEFTMTYANLPRYYPGRVYSLPELQKLVKGLTLSESWQG